MLKFSLLNYSDAYMVVKRTVTITGAEGQGTAAQRQTKRKTGERNKRVICKNCTPLINWISEINNTHVDNAKDLDVVMSMYDLIECSDNHCQTSGSLWQYYKNETDVAVNAAITDSKSLKFKVKITGTVPQ